MPIRAALGFVGASAVALGSLAPPVLAAWTNEPYTNVSVAAGFSNQYSPAIAPDASGGAVIVWDDSRAGGHDIYAQKLQASGEIASGWVQNGRPVCTAAGEQWFPKLVSDGSGGALITWIDERGGIADIYAMHLLASGDPDPVWPPNGFAVCMAPGSQDEPRIASDGSGGAIIAWRDFRNGASNGDIFAQRVLSNGQTAPGWLLNGTAICTAANNQSDPRLVSDLAGGAIIAWTDSRSGAGNDVYAHRVLASGIVDPVWPVDGLGIKTTAGGQGFIEVASDGSGGLIAAWMDNANVYAHHVLQNGALDPAWPVLGSAICQAAGVQWLPQVVSDGQGGAIIAWFDERSGNRDVYAHRVLASGAVDPAWPADGRAISTAPADQEGVVIASDGQGGAFICWEDRFTAFDSDLYAHRISRDGILDTLVPSNGRPVCLANSGQYSVAVVDDGNGGAVLAWADNRNGAGDIYAQRVDDNVFLGTTEPTVVAVQDVANDEGGRVHVLWSGSSRDVPTRYAIRSYTLWRRILPTTAERALSAGAELSTRVTSDETRPVIRLGMNGFGYWEYVATIPSRGFSGYAFMATTTADSMPGYVPWNVFIVDAVDSTGLVFYTSQPDSGYSVDNLAPDTPLSFAGEYANGITTLHWEPSSEEDFAQYRLYHGSQPGFVPGPGNLVAAQPNTGYVHHAGQPYYYKLSAVDVHGNESPFAFLEPTGTTDVPGPSPAALWLGPVTPNPMRGDARIRFSLPQEMSVTVTVYDAGGRFTRELQRGVLPAGDQIRRWDGRDAAGHRTPGGLYFVRLEAEGRCLTTMIAAVW